MSAETPVVAALREVWRRLDRLERVARAWEQRNSEAGGHGDANFNHGQISGLVMAKNVVAAIARELGAKAGVPSTERAVTGVTNANER